jgi:hypothetical protein
MEVANRHYTFIYHTLRLVRGRLYLLDSCPTLTTTTTANNNNNNYYYYYLLPLRLLLLHYYSLPFLLWLLGSNMMVALRITWYCKVKSTFPMHYSEAEQQIMIHISMSVKQP